MTEILAPITVGGGSTLAAPVTVGDHTIAAAVAVGEHTITAPVATVATQTGDTIQLTTASPIGGHRIVYASGGVALLADAGNVAHAGKVVGMTPAAVSAGVVTVVIGNAITEPSWNWTPGPVYLGSNGLPTQTRPTVGFLQEIGVALEPTRLVVDLKPPIIL